MNENLVERIKEFQKCREKLVTIGAEENKERDNIRRYIAKEDAVFHEYVEKERIALEKRLASEKSAFDKKIEDKKAESMKKIWSMREEKDKVNDRIYSLGKNVISIRLGDLIEELANLAGISISDVLVSTNTYIEVRKVYTIEEMCRLMKKGIIKGNNCLLQMTLRSHSFYWRTELSTDLGSMQADGKTFLEHCVVKPGWIGTFLSAEINRNDLIINIPLSKLPVGPDIIPQAIINCVERSQEKEASKDNVKKRSRKLSNETNK